MHRTVKETRSLLKKPETKTRNWTTARCLVYFGNRKRVEASLIRVKFCDRSVKVHKKVAPSLARVEARIRAAEKKNHWKRWVPDDLQSYAYRRKRGGRLLSRHAFCAIDIEPSENPSYAYYGPHCRTTIPVRVIQAFLDEGWTWGGNWNRPCDTMHVSYCGG